MPGERPGSEALFRKLEHNDLYSKASRRQASTMGLSKTAIDMNNTQTQRESLGLARAVFQAAFYDKHTPTVEENEEMSNINLHDSREHSLHQASRSERSLDKITCKANDDQLDESDTEDGYNLETRIRAAISHTHSCLAAGNYPTTFSNFNVPTKPSIILTLLRTAEAKGVATFIYGSPNSECYSLGIPPAPRPFREAHPVWFIGLSRAEMRAGPIRTDADVKVAEREIRYQLGRRHRSETGANGKLKLERDVTIVGLKRQLLGLPMCGKIDEREVKRAMRERGAILDAEGLHEGWEMAEEGAAVAEQEGVLANVKKRKRAEDDIEGGSNKAPKKRRPCATKQPRRPQTRPRRPPPEDSDDEWKPGDL